MLVQHTEQTLALSHIAVAGALVVKVFACKLMKEAELTKHRTNAAHLEHHPLHGLVALGRIRRHQLAGFLRQIDQDGTRLKQRQWLTARAIGVNDGGDFVVGVERDELGSELIVGLKADQVRLIRQAHLFQGNGHLHAVWRGQ